VNTTKHRKNQQQPHTEQFTTRVHALNATLGTIAASRDA